MNKYTIIIPCFNDWECLDILIPKIDKEIKDINVEFSIIIVNDGSTITQNLKIKKLSNIKSIKILNLKKNVKAQIAIATGLDYLKNEKYEGGIIVMDADGQDDPKNIIDIVEASIKDPLKTITINRTTREDVFLFKLFYQIYLIITIVFTNKYMKFGVYSYINSNSLKKILSTNDINMAYVASLVKHFKDKKAIYVPRKKRMTGESKNNYLNLINYALKIISVFKYRVFFNSTMLIVISYFFLNYINYLTLLIFIMFFNILIFSIPLMNKTSNNIERLPNIGNVEEINYLHEKKYS